MGRFAQKHPVELTQLVAVAVANGATAAKVQRDLAAGRLHGWDGPYDMPLETVRYYGKKERQSRAAKTVSPEAQDNPKAEVDRLARLLLSAAQKGLEGARPQIDKDPEALKKWADALKGINALVGDTAQDKAPAKRKPKAPSDPLSATLAAAANQPVPEPPNRERANGHAGAQNAAEPTPDHQHAAAGLPHGEPDWSWATGLPVPRSN